MVLPVERFALRIGTLTGPNELDELDALLDAPCDRDAVTRARRGRELELLEAEPLRPGVAAYLEDSHARASASPSSRAARARGSTGTSCRLGLRDGWDAIICADGDTERCKPSPALYLEALDALDLDAEEAIAIEDSPNGITAARAAGLFCIAVPNEVTGGLDLSHADLLIESFEDVPLAELLARVP